LFLALTGAIPIVLTGSYRAGLFVAGIWLLSVAVLSGLDAWYVPAGGIWLREHDAKLSLGAWNTVALRLQNPLARRLTLQVRDSVPPLLQPQGEAGSGVCEAEGSWALAYRVFPVQRGDFQFGAVSARYLGPLGLVWRQRTHQFVDVAKVYPNLLAINQYDAFVRRGQLQEIGVRNSRRWGAGTEFERLRDYTPDDEYRRIDWNATARRRAPVVVDYETERSQNVILLLDTGRLMSTRLPLEESDDPDVYRGRPLSRLDHAVNASLMLSYVSQQVGDRVGLLAFGDHVSRFMPPRPGRGHFLRIANALYNLQAQPTEPDFGEAMAFLGSRVTRRSLVVLFTDVAGSEAAGTLVRSIAVAARRHLCVVVTLRDPAINALGKQPVNKVDEAYQRAVARLWLDERELALQSLRGRGALTVDTSADAISSDVINRYLEVKARASL
jgi:uncharacterized protein (DUF58 family)